MGEFKGPRARTIDNFEKRMKPKIQQWITAFLKRETSEFLKRYKGGLKVPTFKAVFSGKEEELARLLAGWHFRTHRFSYQQVTGERAVPGPKVEEVQREAKLRAEFEAGRIADELRAELYDGARKYIAEVHDFYAKRGLGRPTTQAIARGMRGLPARPPRPGGVLPSEIIDEPPPMKFRGAPLKDLKSSRDPFSVAARSHLIARTELNEARNTARIDGMKTVGVEYKMWRAFGDTRTRSTHDHLNGVVIPIDEDFSWTTEGKRGARRARARAPGDTRLPPGERCNCRCAIVMATEQEHKRFKDSSKGRRYYGT
jgi:hypothetical protein